MLRLLPGWGQLIIKRSPGAFPRHELARIVGGGKLRSKSSKTGDFWRSITPWGQRRSIRNWRRCKVASPPRSKLLASADSPVSPWSAIRWEMRRKSYRVSPATCMVRSPAWAPFPIRRMTTSRMRSSPLAWLPTATAMAADATTCSLRTTAARLPSRCGCNQQSRARAHRSHSTRVCRDCRLKYRPAAASTSKLASRSSWRFRSIRITRAVRLRSTRPRI